VLLADRMNGAALPQLHGAPLRAIVPGWFGMASAKWITRVRVEATPSDNHFMVKGYRYNYPGVDPAQAAPVEELKVKSLITRPLAGARVPSGNVRVTGFAWAGPAGLTRVEVSGDGGKTWHAAQLVGERADLAWREWSADVVARAGAMTVMARATDGAGDVQPDAAKPNGGGYGNNSIHRVSFHVGA
jgi:DMSO/TMAO reductase YedYZ molybdopterin-dependent catalytic subunit